MSFLPQYQTTRAAREDGTIWSKKNNWSEVREPPNALFVTGRGARSWAHVSHLRKMLLPTMRTPPGAGAGAAANFATSPVYWWRAGERLGTAPYEALRGRSAMAD